MTPGSEASKWLGNPDVFGVSLPHKWSPLCTGVDEVKFATFKVEIKRRLLQRPQQVRWHLALGQRLHRSVRGISSSGCPRILGCADTHQLLRWRLLLFLLWDLGTQEA